MKTKIDCGCEKTVFVGIIKDLLSIDELEHFTWESTKLGEVLERANKAIKKAEGR